MSSSVIDLELPANHNSIVIRRYRLGSVIDLELRANCARCLRSNSTRQYLLKGYRWLLQRFDGVILSSIFHDLAATCFCAPLSGIAFLVNSTTSPGFPTFLNASTWSLILFGSSEANGASTLTLL